MSEPAPRPFRQPATISALQCLACGAPIELHTFGAQRQVACHHCGSILGADDAGRLALLEKVQRARRATTLALYRRGELMGNQWEIVGVMLRSTSSSGETYTWEEYLLFNPFAGFRYLVHNLWDNAWMLATPAQAMASRTDGGGLWQDGRFDESIRTVAYRREELKLFQRSQAKVEYVEGEFPWEVKVGDRARIYDYIAPPRGLSLEWSQTIEDQGQELNLTELVYLTSAQVGAAFGTTLSATSGVPMLAPNPHLGYGRGYLLAGLALGFAWLMTAVAYAGLAPGKIVVNAAFELSTQPTVVHTQAVHLGQGTRATTLAVELSRPPEAIEWASANVVVVHDTTGQAYALPVASAGDPESEPGQALVGNVPAGDYNLMITLEAAAPALALTNPATVTLPSQVTVTVRESVYLFRYLLIPLLVIILGPLLHLVFRGSFEKKRWENAD